MVTYSVDQIGDKPCLMTIARPHTSELTERKLSQPYLLQTLLGEILCAFLKEGLVELTETTVP
jgi:hypothetical protein